VHVSSGLFYVGITRDQRPGSREISTVDLNLHVSAENPSSLRLPGNVPVPYDQHSWPARLTYLRWLTDRDKYVEQNFLLLYLCGLEHRALAALDSPRWPAADLPALRREAERLLRRHKHHAHFAEKVRAFLDLLNHLAAPGRLHTGGGERPAPGQRTYRSVNPNGYTVHFGMPLPGSSREKNPQPSTPQSSATQAPPVPLPLFSPAAPVPIPSNPQAHDRRPSTTDTRDDGGEEPSSAPAEEEAPFLDRRLLAEVQADVRNSDALLADLYADDEKEVTGTHQRSSSPANVVASSDTGEDGTDADGGTGGDDSVRLAAGPAALLAVLASSTEWPRSVASTEARRLGLMLGAALEAINEYAVDTVDAPLVEEEGQTLFLDEEVLTELPLRGLRADVRGRVLPEGPNQAPGSQTAVVLPTEADSVSDSPPRLRAEPPRAQPLAVSPADHREPVRSVPTAPRPEPPRWIGPDERVHIQGRDIDGGLFYLGTPAHTNVAPETIDPLLSVAARGAAKHTALTTKVRSYGILDPGARASHLDWLARGRVGEVGENSLFLFVTGMEKRALVDLAGDPGLGSGLRDLVRGLREVIASYPALRRFHSRADNLCAVLERLAANTDRAEDQPRPPSPATHAHGVPPHLLYGLGWLARRGHNVDAEWALSWSMHHPQVQPALRLRTDPGFHTVFRELFARRFPNGIVLPPLERRLGWTYTPIHPRIDPVLVPTDDVADYSKYTHALSSLRVLVKDAADQYARRGGSALPNPAVSVSEADPVGGSEKVVRSWGPPRHDREDVPSPSVEDSASERSSGRWSLWRAPGTAVRVGPYIVSSGMLYTGYAPEPDLIDNVQWASAIDLGLPLERVDVIGDERVTRKITGYSELSPRQRGQYLLWLSKGRTEPAPVVFARLFLNGLERRLVEVLRADKASAPALAPISRELSKLRDVFGDHAEMVHDIDQLVRLYRYAQQAGWSRSKGLPEHTYTHRSRCPGLGTVQVPLPRTSAEQGKAVLPEGREREPLESDAGSPGSTDPRTAGTASEQTAEPRVSAGARQTRPDSAQNAEPERRRAFDTEEQTPPVAPAEPSSAERAVRAQALLGLQLALRATGVGPGVRSVLVRGLRHLADIDLDELSRFRLHTCERETPESLTDLVAVLAALPLRDRESAGDLLLESAEAAGGLSTRQTALLLWIHRRLGTEGVFRLRLSERGAAPARTEHANRSADSEPAIEAATVSAPPVIARLAEPYACLLADLGKHRAWKRADVARLACWYGLEDLDAIDTINEEAWGVGDEDVLVEEGTRVSVNSALLKEMTR
jgi:hypothetical protein